MDDLARDTFPLLLSIRICITKEEIQYIILSL